MIIEFVSAWESRKGEIEASFRADFPLDYLAIVRAVIRAMSSDRGESPDENRIHQIDDGDYQGTLVFVIGATGYQPSTYWYVRVSYGSCSWCDTLERIRYGAYGESTDAQVAALMTLALHIVQGLKVMGGDTV